MRRPIFRASADIILRKTLYVLIRLRLIKGPTRNPLFSMALVTSYPSCRRQILPCWYRPIITTALAICAVAQFILSSYWVIQGGPIKSKLLLNCHQLILNPANNDRPRFDKIKCEFKGRSARILISWNWIFYAWPNLWRSVTVYFKLCYGKIHKYIIS